MSDKLIYFLAETHLFSQRFSALVVTLLGPLSKANAPQFQECMDEVLRTKSTWVVLNFRDVPGSVDPSFLDILRGVRRAFEGSGIQMRYSGLHPKLRSTFVKEGIASDADFSNNLTDALKLVPVLKMNAA